MALSIEAIKFNRDSSSATHDALNIRVNSTTFVTVPEWQKGASVNPSDSPAAYAIGAVGANTITIQARFRLTPAPFPGPVSIRAVTVGLKLPPFWPFIPFNPLGDVSPASFVFDANGNSGWVTFKCTGHLGNTVRATNITWQWQALDPKTNTWVPFATTKHRIYVLLGIPTSPWQQTPYNAGNTQLPRTAVLDFACSWASGASTRDAAAGRITDHVFALD